LTFGFKTAVASCINVYFWTFVSSSYSLCFRRVVIFGCRKAFIMTANSQDTLSTDLARVLTLS